MHLMVDSFELFIKSNLPNENEFCPNNQKVFILIAIILQFNVVIIWRTFSFAAFIKIKFFITLVGFFFFVFYISISLAGDFFSVMWNIVIVKVNPFHVNHPCLYLLNTSQDQKFLAFPGVFYWIKQRCEMG